MSLTVDNREWTNNPARFLLDADRTALGQEEARSVTRSALHAICTHCGSVGAQRIGLCSVCDTPVCEKCGNTQITLTGTKVMHDSCLKESAQTSFSMIKFVE